MNMKITQEHYKHMESCITQSFSREWVNTYSMEVLKAYEKAGKTRDQVNKRVRHDLVYNTIGLTKWICDTIYKYADDSHLDTALKQIVKNNYPHAIK